MSWWEISVLVPHSLADDAASLLVDAGAASVEICDEQFGMQKSAPVPEGKALLRASYVHPATEQGDPAQASQAAGEALRLLNLGAAAETMQIRSRDDVDWQENWKRFFTPIYITAAQGPLRLSLVPPWEEKSHRARLRDLGGSSHLLLIDPGMAFGTGHHETTRLCLQALIDSPPVHRVLDMGCGSGVLSIAAAMLGARTVHACDIDPQALKATKANASLNGCAGKISISGTPLPPGHSGGYDLVIANIIAHILCDLASALQVQVAARGQLLLSGIPTDQRDQVEHAFAVGSTWQVEKELREGEWLALLLRRQDARAGSSTSEGSA